MKILCLILLIFLQGCQSSSKSSTNLKEAIYKQEIDSSKLQFTELCPSPSRACEDKYDPAQCYIKKYNGRDFFPWNKPIAWGDNPCLTLEKLNVLICQLGLNPTLAHGIECVPDASRAVCATDTKKCEPSHFGLNTQNRSFFCVANTYQGQKLSEEQKIVGWGIGKCEAERQLKSLACRMNLNPILLGEISCVDEPRVSECVRTKIQCTDKSKITNCRAQLKNTIRMVEVTADSECAAREWIAYRACQKLVAPSDVKEIECR